MKKELQKPPSKPKMDWYGKAVEYQKMLSTGVAKNKAEIARIEGVSRARVTQILNLINLAPEIRNYPKLYGRFKRPQNSHRKTAAENRKNKKPPTTNRKFSGIAPEKNY